MPLYLARATTQATSKTRKKKSKRDYKNRIQHDQVPRVGKNIARTQSKRLIHAYDLVLPKNE